MYELDTIFTMLSLVTKLATFAILASEHAGHVMYMHILKYCDDSVFLVLWYYHFDVYAFMNKIILQVRRYGNH